jgi:Protein of unknown function (DUF4246)
MIDVDVGDLDNSGTGPLRVPGFNGIPPNATLPPEQRFAHGLRDALGDGLIGRLTAREMTMLHVMNSVTESTAWNTDIFNKNIIERWRREYEKSEPLLSQRAWDWCVAELQDKAKQFENTGFIKVFDTKSPICKSSVLIRNDLQQRLKAAVMP